MDAFENQLVHKNAITVHVYYNDTTRLRSREFLGTFFGGGTSV
jgi:hypothetical protein